MAKAIVQPLEDAELEEGVGRLRIAAYPHMPEVRDTEFHAFIYRWFEDHPLADEVYRWVAISGDRVVGHLSATPQYYRINGQRVVAHTPGDYMVDPEYSFQALSLMRRFFRATENCVACDMLPSVIGVETRLGAEVAGEMSYAAKLMNVGRLPVPPLPTRMRRLLRLPEREDNASTPRPRVPLPAPVRGILNQGLQVLDSGLGKAFGGNLETEVIEEFDESFDELFEKVAVAVPCTAEKDEAFLRWRYGPGSPQHPVTVLGVREGDTLLGYAILKTTAGQDGYILDLVRLPGRHDVARALLRDAVSAFRVAGVHIIRYRFLESPVSARRRDLARLGFFFRTTRHNLLLVKFADTSLHGTARRISNWSYTIGDGESSFWAR